MRSFFICSMSAAKRSTLEESDTLARHCTTGLFCTEALALCAVAGLKEGGAGQRVQLVQPSQLVKT